MGPRPWAKDSARAASPAKAHLSGFEYACPGPRPDRLPVPALRILGKADALRILRGQLDWHSSRHDRETAHRLAWIPTGEARPPCFSRVETRLGLSRRPPLWPRAISPRKNAAKLVARRWARHSFNGVRSEIPRQVSRTPRASAHQIRFAFAKRVCRNRQLDGRR